MAFKTSNDIIFPSTAVAADARSEIVDLTNQYLVAIQAVWVNGAAANIDVKIEVSLDKLNWVELAAPTFNIATASGTDIVQITDFAYKYFRVFMDRAAGTADIEIRHNGKGI